MITLSVASQIYKKILQRSQFYLPIYVNISIKRYSTKTALVSMLENWRLFVDKKHFVGEFVMDLRKAFKRFKRTTYH